MLSMLYLYILFAIIFTVANYLSHEEDITFIQAAAQSIIWPIILLKAIYKEIVKVIKN